MECNTIEINKGIILTSAALFGGTKVFSTGWEDSKYGIDNYLKLKYLSMGGLKIGCFQQVASKTPKASMQAQSKQISAET